MKRIRILLADDHTLVGDGFRKLLAPEFEVVGTVGDGRALLKAAEVLKPVLKPDLVFSGCRHAAVGGVGCSAAVEEVDAEAKDNFPYNEP